MNKTIKDVEKLQKIAKEKEGKPQLDEADAKELLEALQVSLNINRAVIISIKGGKDE